MTYIRRRAILLVDVNPMMSILGQPPDGAIGTAYSFIFGTFGGTAPYRWSVVGDVPDGWSFNTSTGELSNASPDTPGEVTITLKLRDADFIERTQSFTWSIFSLPLAITNNPPNYTAGVPQNFTYISTGGAGVKTWAVFSGALPPGITLDTDGTFHGTTVDPSGIGAPGFYVYVWEVRVVDAYGAEDIDLNSVVVTVIAIFITNSAPDGEVDTPYSHTYTSSGGTGTKTWDVASGTLPAGLSLSSAGVLSGTPTIGATYNFTVRVTDAGGTIATLPESVFIDTPTYRYQLEDGSGVWLTEDGDPIRKETDT